MADDTQQQPQAPPDLNAAIQALIQQQIAAASGQGQQVQLPSMPQPQQQTQWSDDPSKGPNLLQRIGLAIGGGSLPGAPAELRAQMGSQALMDFGMGLMSAPWNATPGQQFAGGLRQARGGLLGQEAAIAGQQENALNAQTKLAELGMQQQKNRTEALTALVPLMQMAGRLGQPLFGPGSSAAGPPGSGGDTALTGDWEHDAPIIKQRESGGNYDASNYVAEADPTAYARGATASGAYQIVNSTWREGMQLAGLDPSQYPTARSAPPAVQDKVAQALYAKHGTAPWDASKFGANWVQQPGGGYQLVKGAQPPASGPGSAVGPYRGPPTTTAAAAPPAGSTAATDDTFFPTAPAQPAAGGKSIADLLQPPDKASAGNVVPGGGGLGASVATAGPGAPTGGAPSLESALRPATGGPPPVGPITVPPPAQPQPQPPSAQPAQPPQQPPTPPAEPAAPPVQPSRHDLVMEKNPDGTYKMPNDQVSQNEFLERERTTYSPQELQARGVILPDNPAEAQAKFAAVQKANATADAARTAASALYGTMKDPSDAIKQVNAANEQAQKANQDYATYLQGSNEKNADALQKIYQQQDDRNATAYQKQVTEPKTAAALEAQRGKQQMAQTDESQRIQYINSQQGKLDEEAAKARENTWQLGMLQGLSEASGGANPIGEMELGGRSVRDWLLNSGIGTQAQVAKWTAQDAFKAGITKFAQDMRAGQGMGRLTNQELTVLMQMLPNTGMDPGAREAIMDYMGQLYQRKSDFALHTANHLSDLDQNGKPVSFSGAMDAADKELGPILPQVPKESSGSIEARDQWLRDSGMRPNTLFRQPNGKIAIYRGEAPAGGQ